jgi:hypothetical protein
MRWIGAVMPYATIVYVSSASRPMSDEDLKQILEVSRKNNAANNITGMLLYRDGYFIQALEGDEAAVTRTLEKISQDPRHADVLTFYKSVHDERTFGAWQMGFQHLDRIDPALMPNFTEFLDKPIDENTITANPNRTWQLLEQFRDQTYF